MDRFVLSLLHFNIQYCAGGTDGLIKVEGYPTDDASVMDQTVVESFEPVLDLLARHPTWHMDLEMQAYMVEWMADRHTGVLAKLKTLADAGQVEIVSFTYSDQLFTAFPWRDEEKSLELTQEIFAENGLPLSDVVFTQEGQFGEGMLQRMPAWGYRTAVLPHNLAQATWGVDSPQATYRYGSDVRVLIGGQGFTTADYSVEWNFLNDGELYVTNNLNCYVGPAFVADDDAIARKEAELQALEDAGAKIASVSEFMAAHGDDVADELPAVVDGTWQPDDTENLGLWMGGMGQIFAADEDDLVRTLNVRARHRLAAAEQVDEADAALLDEGWREALLGEVSDATGWNPWTTEVAYGKDHASSAYELADAAIADACEARGATSRLRVDIATGDITPDAEETDVGGTAIDAPLAVAFPGRPGTASWTTTADADVSALTANLEGGDDDAVTEFPWDGEEIATIPALSETMREIPADQIAMDPIGLPIALGVVQLAAGVWLVQKTDSTHLAAHFDKGAASGSPTISFRDETAPFDARIQEYLLVQGDAARATEVAIATNEAPIVDLTCPAAKVGVEQPCGCESGGEGGGLVALGIATGVAARRRGRTPRE